MTARSQYAETEEAGAAGKHPARVKAVVA